MSLRPHRLAALGLQTPTGGTGREAEQVTVPVIVAVVEKKITEPIPGVTVEQDAVEIALAEIEVGAKAKVKRKNPKRQQLGFYWQELNKEKYWAPDGKGIRCGTCAFFDDGTKPNEPRKDEFNLLGKCKIMDIEDNKVHSQACCNLYRRPRDPGNLHPENEMWPPAYPSSCPPAKGQLVLHDCKGRRVI